MSASFDVISFALLAEANLEFILIIWCFVNISEWCHLLPYQIIAWFSHRHVLLARKTGLHFIKDKKEPIKAGHIDIMPNNKECSTLDIQDFKISQSQAFVKEFSFNYEYFTLRCVWKVMLISK